MFLQVELIIVNFPGRALLGGRTPVDARGLFVLSVDVLMQQLELMQSPPGNRCALPPAATVPVKKKKKNPS